MPKPITVLISWGHSSPPDMASFALAIAEKIANAGQTFPNPTVSKTDMDAAANRLELAFSNRMNGPAAKTELETADKNLDTLLHAQAVYVSTIANGSPAIIQSAGFVASSTDRHAATTPATPGAAAIKGNAASLHLQIHAVPGATSYCWIIFTDAAATATVSGDHIVITGAAIVIPDGSAREALNNVIPAGTKIGVRVLAQNTAGKSALSAQVNITVGDS